MCILTQEFLSFVVTGFMLLCRHLKNGSTFDTNWYIRACLGILNNNFADCWKKMEYINFFII